MLQEDDGNVNRIEAFPILIFSKKNFLTTDQLNKIKPYLEKHGDLKPHGAIVNDETSLSTHHADSNILTELTQLDGCETILNNLIVEIKTYLKQSGFQLETHTINSWFNIQNKGSVLKQHNHYNSVLSGALYININADSSPIVFDNPNTNLFMGMPNLDTSKKFSQEEIIIHPQKGELLLFPSFLRHGSGGMINYSDNRIIISFNVQ